MEEVYACAGCYHLIMKFHIIILILSGDNCNAYMIGLRWESPFIYVMCRMAFYHSDTWKLHKYKDNVYFLSYTS